MEKILLYRTTLQIVRKYPDYNIREFFLRKTREEFRISDWSPQSASANIKMLERQVTIAILYPTSPSSTQTYSTASSLGYKPYK